MRDAAGGYWGYYVARNANNQRDVDYWRPRRITALEQSQKLQEQFRELCDNPPIDFVDHVLVVKKI